MKMDNKYRIKIMRAAARANSTGLLAYLLNERENTNSLFWGSKERELLTLCKILAGRQLEIKYKWTHGI